MGRPVIGDLAHVLSGVELHVSASLPSDRWVQVRFPRSKRKRIRKKWRKDERNWALRPLPPVCYRVDSWSMLGGLTSAARPRFICNQRFFDLVQAGRLP